MVTIKQIRRARTRWALIHLERKLSPREKGYNKKLDFIRRKRQSM